MSTITKPLNAMNFIEKVDKWIPHQLTQKNNAPFNILYKMPIINNHKLYLTTHHHVTVRQYISNKTSHFLR